MAARQPKATGSKAKLVNATVGLLAAKGFRGTITDEILEISGVSRSNFYYHFDSKEALCLAALERIGYMFLVTVVNQTLANTVFSPAERIESYFNYLIEVVETNACDIGCVFTNLASETQDLDPAFHEKILEVDGKVARALEHTLRDGLETGEFRLDGDVQDAAWMMLALFKGATVLSTTRRDPEILRQCRNAAFNLLKA